MNFTNFSKGMASLLLLTGLMATGCYDDSDLKNQLDSYGNRIEQLENLTQKQNTEIAYLKTIADALESNDYVTKVEPIKKGQEIIGYTIIFKKSGKVEILNGKEGAPGKDGKAPQIGVKQDTDGNYYWTLDGEWLLDNGKKIPTSGKEGAAGQTGAAGKDGVTPKLKIENGMWYISYTNGLTWEKDPLGPATGGASGQGGSSMFSNVTYDENFVYLTLANDATVLKIPRAKEGQSTTGAVTVTLANTKIHGAVFNGTINATAEELDYIRVILRYGLADKFIAIDESMPSIVYNKNDFGSEKSFTMKIKGLEAETAYKYCIIVQNRSEIIYGDVQTFTTDNKYDSNLNFKDEKLTAVDINNFVSPAEYVHRLSVVKSGNNLSSEADASIRALGQQEIDGVFGAGYTVLPQDAWSIVADNMSFTGAETNKDFEIKFVSAKVKQLFGCGLQQKYCIAFELTSYDSFIDSAKKFILLEIKNLSNPERLTLVKDMLYSTHGHWDEGKDLGALLDDEPSTYWHADYENKVLCEEGLGFEIDLTSFGKQFHSFKIGYHTRVSYSINPSKIVLYGSSNNGTDWFEIGALTMKDNGLPSDDNTDYESIALFSSQGFNRLKYAVPESYNKHKDQLKHPGSGDWGTYAITDFRLWAE